MDMTNEVFTWNEGGYITGNITFGSWTTGSTAACLIPYKTKEESKKRMNIYFICVVDAIENILVKQPQFVVAKTEQDAGACFDLSAEEKKLVSKGDYQLVVEAMASYEPVEISIVRNK